MKLNVSDKIKSIKPYVPGKPIEELEREYNIKNAVKLASNENPVGFSPKVNEAVVKYIDKMNRYPDGSGHNLTNKIAQKFNVKANNVVIGNGSDDIIALLSLAFLNQDDEAVIPFPTFLMYEIAVKTAKATPVKIPLKDYNINLEILAKNISDKTRMVFLTNPFNPTGSVISKKTFKDFLKSIPEDLIVVMDEAYIEFVRSDDVYNSLTNPLEDPRVVTLRTFSKAYGLAGFRVGYGIMSSDISDIIQRIRQPFNVNSLAQIAASAALDDFDFFNRSLNIIHKGIDYLDIELKKMGLDALPTESNFLMVDLKEDATPVFKKMLEHGVIVRSMESYGFPSFLRINAGTKEENLAFILALKKVLNKG